MIDLQGQLVVPGFIESHGHFTGVGEAQLDLKLMPTTSWDQIVAMVAEAAKTAKPANGLSAAAGTRRSGRHAPEPERRRVSDACVARRGLARQSRSCSTHASGHAIFVNAQGDGRCPASRARRRAPAGGEILKDAAGNPTGCCARRRDDLVRDGARATRTRRDRKALELASPEALSKGITSFQDAGSSFATIDLMKQLIDEGRIGRAAVGDGARGQRARRRRGWRSTGRSTTATAI